MMEINGNVHQKFIDISEWNGAISIEQYQLLKSEGIKGVVVKLTEGTVYRNPLARLQIENAKKAGLRVSTYHFSWFENEREAIDQADYYVNYAEELDINKDTTMVNDAETGPMINADATKVSICFRDQLNKRGFKNVVHYSNAEWFNKDWMELNTLGRKNCWIAHWATEYNKDKLLYSDMAAWQYTNKRNFNFLKGDFDCNIDYIGRFT